MTKRANTQEKQGLATGRPPTREPRLAQLHRLARRVGTYLGIVAAIIAIVGGLLAIVTEFISLKAENALLKAQIERGDKLIIVCRSQVSSLDIENDILTARLAILKDRKGLYRPLISVLGRQPSSYISIERPALESRDLLSILKVNWGDGSEEPFDWTKKTNEHFYRLPSEGTITTYTIRWICDFKPSQILDQSYPDHIEAYRTVRAEASGLSLDLDWAIPGANVLTSTAALAGPDPARPVDPVTSSVESTGQKPDGTFSIVKDAAHPERFHVKGSITTPNGGVLVTRDGSGYRVIKVFAQLPSEFDEEFQTAAVNPDGIYLIVYKPTATKFEMDQVVYMSFSDDRYLVYAPTR